MPFIFLPNIPQGTDFLDQSWIQLLSNNQSLDGIFGIDHYKFSDTTANQGFHNKVTTPVFVDNPPTGLPPVTVTDPVFYGFQQTVPVGIIQYSRGPTNAVPTPVTKLQSPSTALAPIVLNGTVNVLDFTGLTRAICTLHAGNFVQAMVTDIIQALVVEVLWNGTVLDVTTISPFVFPMSAQASGSILQLKNNGIDNLTGVFWTLEMHRLE